MRCNVDGVGGRPYRLVVAPIAVIMSVMFAADPEIGWCFAALTGQGES